MKKIIKTASLVFSFNLKKQLSSVSTVTVRQHSSIQPQVPLGFKSRASSDYYMTTSR
jgi:hypothetical protein